MLVTVNQGTDAQGRQITKEVETEVQIQGKVYDAMVALPFTVGDWRRLKAQHQIDILKLQGNIELDTMCNMVLALFAKLGPAKLSDVEALGLGRMSDLVALIVQGERLDYPTSTPSTG